MSNNANPRIIKFTNGLLLRDTSLVPGDLWIDSLSGYIISPQSAFYTHNLTPDTIIDLQGKILCPGFLDVQLNGAHGFDFSVPDPEYTAKLRSTAQKLIKSGVTSYLPTITSQKPNVYHSNLPHLGPLTSRRSEDGSESLGAHVEGPFLSPARNGIHTSSVLQSASSFADLESTYGSKHLTDGTIKKITAAPELGCMLSLIPEITSRGIVYSIGHSDANFEEASKAIEAGATMVTHMFNAMRSFGHRDPGIFGLLGQSSSSSRPSSPKSSAASSPRTSHVSSSTTSSPSSSPRNSRRPSPRSSLSISTSISDLSRPSLATSTTTKPFFGLIADLHHLSSQTLSIAHHAHPSGSILVTDAMPLAGLPDGIYEWTNGEHIVKNGSVLTLEKNGRIAGSAVTLIECVNNFFGALGGYDVEMREVEKKKKLWAEVLGAVTHRPAKMLGVETRKGGLGVGMDADLVVLDEQEDGRLRVDGVWKFGVQVA